MWTLILATSLFASDPQVETNCSFLQLLKICEQSMSTRLHPMSVGSPSSGTLCSELAPCEVTLDSQPFTHFSLYISTSLPFHPLIGVPEPRRGGERGHRVKVFSSLDLGACWERLGERMAALELGLGVKILILLKNSWFEFLLTSLFPPSLHKSREMKNLFRGEPVK